MLRDRPDAAPFPEAGGVRVRRLVRVTTTGSFSFARGNLAKLWAAPKYVLGLLLSWFVPRDRRRWVFGSGIGVGEGALALAQELRRSDPDAHITWVVGGDSLDENPDADAARRAGFTPQVRASWAGLWATLRAHVIVVTHGLGDANRYGVFGARIVHLGHGAPLKKLHLDSPVTTAVQGPALLRAILRRMYLSGARRVELYVAGSIATAERLRTAHRVAPGRVRVLGDPRDDMIAQQAADPAACAAARSQVRELLGVTSDVPAATEPLVLYAPTWRDGAADPGVPGEEQLAAIHALLDARGARLVIRAHRLGAGAYEQAAGDRVHLLGADTVADITPLLAAFDVVITDYSSIAIDYALLGRPILWFAPDLAQYQATRGLYEPLEVTAAGQVVTHWDAAVERLARLLSPGSAAWRQATRDARALARRFHAFPEGRAAARVLAEIRRLGLPARDRIVPGGIFFESYYGRQVSCHPLALDQELATRFPGVPRYWSVVSERLAVPDGATPVLVGGPDWLAARRLATLLVVNDWLRFGFRRRRGQTVLQTWHGTMLKHLALGRPHVGIRTRIAILRERRRWSLMLSQNPHATEQFRRSYAFRGEILEVGYPRDDRLARALVGRPGERNPVEIERARRALGVPPGARVLAYVPTWREDARSPGAGSGVVDPLDVHRLVAELAADPRADWVVVARGHTRTHEFGGYGGLDARVIDASRHPDVNDVMLAADLLVTDYSSVMFDAAVARVPLAFFVPDLAAYRDRERGFTFDFATSAPGPLLTTREGVIETARLFAGGPGAAEYWNRHGAAYQAWVERFAPHDDGQAAQRVVQALVDRGAI